MRKNKNKIPKAFLVALLFAMLFWLLTKLSKEYSTAISFPVEYVDIPQDKLIQKEPLKQVDIQIKASGFRLIGLGFSTKIIKLDAKKLLRKSASEYYFLLQNQKIDFQHQITKTYAIDHILQDTLYLSLGTLTSKKIPLVGDFELSYKLGYHLTKPIKITPDSILVSGSKQQVDALHKIELQRFVKKNISEKIKTTLRLKEVSNTIKFTVKEAVISGEVDRFTEGSLEIPFEIINLPDSISVNTFPTTVKVIFQVGLTNFNSVNSSFFKVVCDYQQSLANNLNYLIPKVTIKPSFITSVRLNSEKIEFLIQK
jgi:hypothetical protein